MLRRAPRPELAPFVRRVWAADGDAPCGDRELVLPTGTMHVVIRLDEPLRVFDGLTGAAPRNLGHAIIGGARAAPYVRDVSRPVRSVGAQLRPGVAELLLGVPAIELAERHTRLDDLWGGAAAELRERLALALDAGQRLALFEAALLARLPRVRALHPAIAHALAQFARADDVAGVVAEVGYSHRRFIALFHHAVGLTPKRYCRVQRLQRAIPELARRSLAEVAAGAGYSDQAHLTREFRALAGVSPGAYRALSPESPHHLVLTARSPTRHAEGGSRRNSEARDGPKAISRG
jgi:AraC-like DNA-binding protein